MSRFPVYRSACEPVPFDGAIEPWFQKCEPALMDAVGKDYAAIRDQAFDGARVATNKEKPLYLGTAGSPCSGKSTELDLEIEGGKDPRYSGIVMVDPDRYAMDYMNYTYRPLLSAGSKARLGFAQAAKQAYDRARPGSNIIANLILNEAVDRGYHVAHGSTLTSPFSGNLLQSIADAGYERHLMVVYADTATRVEAGKKRADAEAHYQVDTSDFEEKAGLFPQRMADYFRHGDLVTLFFKADVNDRAVPAARFKKGKRVVLNKQAFAAFTTQYEIDRAKLMQKGTELPGFGDVQGIYEKRFDKPARGRGFKPG